MVNFYGCIIPNCADIQSPLEEIVLSEVFLLTKEALANATLLAHPNHEAALHLVTDASGQALSKALYQVVDRSSQPFSFFHTH
ncbi:unnamed protein product [Protopolystoma xenopodis]|uniref:Reverse transcriptase/retrotransposon-derived protein RNase H-like domain-containing protein n=1 Tax=Protopolystoma xenopodis TaxID=117903 RepID=A0A3S4ZQN9_9PLAT|nr:unnamed protein product [Protopolystoma xenopodis]